MLASASVEEAAAAWASRGLFVLLSWSLTLLFASGNWKGCVISAAWCTGDGPLELPFERMRRAFVVLVGLSSLCCELIASNAGDKKFPRIHLSQKFAWGSVVCMGVCLVAPMSCDALGEEQWYYLRWTDPLHDLALGGSFTLFSISVLVRPLSWNLPPSVSIFVASAVPMVILVNWCPVLAPRWRITILALEVTALTSAHLAHLFLCRESRKTSV